MRITHGIQVTIGHVWHKYVSVRKEKPDNYAGFIIERLSSFNNLIVSISKIGKRPVAPECSKNGDAESCATGDESGACPTCIVILNMR